MAGRAANLAASGPARRPVPLRAPRPPASHANPELGDETDLFIGLHIAQLFLIMGLGYVLWLLVEGVTNRAATVARALIIPFLVAYTALDAILGIAWGIAAETANDLPAADQPGAGRLIDELDLRRPGPTGPHPLLGCRPALARGGARRRRGAQGHRTARCPRVDVTRRSGVHARPRPTDGSGRDGLVPARHRLGRVPPPSGTRRCPRRQERDRGGPDTRHQRPPLGHGFGRPRGRLEDLRSRPGPACAAPALVPGCRPSHVTGPGLDRAIHASAGQHTPYPRTRCLPPRSGTALGRALHIWSSSSWVL